MGPTRPRAGGRGSPRRSGRGSSPAARPGSSTSARRRAAAPASRPAACGAGVRFGFPDWLLQPRRRPVPQLRDGELDRADPRFPVSLAVAVAAADPLRRALAISDAADSVSGRAHQHLGEVLDHRPSGALHHEFTDRRVGDGFWGHARPERCDLLPARRDRSRREARLGSEASQRLHPRLLRVPPGASPRR